VSRNLSVRRTIVVPRTSMKLAAAVAVAGLAVSACSTTKMGAAALTGGGRISTAKLTGEVANLNSAYAADKAKGITPQRPTSQEAQQVLTWLIVFKVYGRLATQHNIHVTNADADRVQDAYTRAASQSGVNLDEYLSAGYALPPDLQPQFFQAAAIGSALDGKLDGGKTPTTSAGQSALSSMFSHDACLAAKDLDVNVNPQYGEFDYTGFQVVPAPPTLAADPTPSPSSSALLTPPC
jgi:hypothetical protein